MEEHKAATNIIGLKDMGMDTFTVGQLKQVAQKGANKLSQLVQNDVFLKVHIRRYKAVQRGKEHKYSVKAHLILPGDTVTVDKAFDWNPVTAVRKAVSDMENRVENIFRERGHGRIRHSQKGE